MTPPAGATSVTVSAAVSTAGDPNPTNNNAGPVTFPINANYPDLTPSIGAVAGVQFGVQSNIPITVSNVGPNATTGAITATITLPPNTTVPANFTSGGFICTTAGLTVTCTNPGPINGTASVTIPVPPALAFDGGDTGPCAASGTTVVNGLVTAVNGGFRHTTASARGAWAHSGATPRRFRQDAVLAVADLAALMEGSWDRIEADVIDRNSVQGDGVCGLLTA